MEQRGKIELCICNYQIGIECKHTSFNALAIISGGVCFQLTSNSFDFVCFSEADEFNIKASLSEQVCVLEYRIRLRKNFAICDSAVSRPHPNARSRRDFTFASADQLAKYRISSIRRRGYYFFAVRFSAATNRGRILFEGGVYFVGKPADSNDG